MIYSLVYNFNMLDLGIVVFGVIIGFDVNGLLEQGGGVICVFLDVVGVVFDIEDCGCQVSVGILEVIGDLCLDGGSVILEVKFDYYLIVLIGFEIFYVLIFGEGLVIEVVNVDFEFIVDVEGCFIIYMLVYDLFILDFSIVVLGVIIGFDVNGLLE